jgi:fused signal recognition particle receptor
MFGKIKGKLKNVFKNSEDYVENNHDRVEEVEVQEETMSEVSENSDVSEDHILKEDDIEKSEEPKEKKGFLGRLFGSSDGDVLDSGRDVQELEHIENEMLEGVSESEKSAIKEHHDLSKNEISENISGLEDKEKVEEKLEKKTMSDIENTSRMDEISDELETDVDGENLDTFKKIPDEVSNSEVEQVSDVVKLKVLDSVEKTGFFSKLKAKTISSDDFDNIWVELQIFLLEINIAFEIVEKVGIKLKAELIGKSFNRFKLSEKIREVLESEVEEVLKIHEANFLDKLNSFSSGEPIKILVLGVNGTGKTTTIAKIVKYLQDNNKSVVVAAADTFRAAAVEQLEEHSKALNFKLIMHKGGSDPAAVAFDAIEHAKAKKIDVVLIDTAGRMPNNSNLMIELEKVKRVSKSDMAIFVGDSVSGNDLIDQINLFNQGVEVDGTILTKVDTDEKPGSVVTIAYSIDKPIYFLGVGQGYDDLIVFDSKEIAKKLFEIED